MKGGKSKAGKADNKLSVTKKPTATTKAKGKAAEKDPAKPKRPASAFFVFMEDFRKQYKEKHPNNKSVAAVGKAGGERWKQMSDDDKAPYIAKAEKRKKEYTKTMDAYNKRMTDGPPAAEEEEDESDKSKSEVNDEDDDDDESSEEEDDDDDDE